MSEYDKMHDYLRDQSSYDRFPEAWKVKELYDQKIKSLERQLAEAREAICIHVREHMDCGGIDNDDEAVIYFKNTFNEKNYN